jgi:hypothetical protein
MRKGGHRSDGISEMATIVPSALEVKWVPDGPPRAARPYRRLVQMSRLSALAFVLLLAQLLMLPGPDAVAAGHTRDVSDGVLRIPLQPGWFGAVGPGVEAGHRVAWILVGNFAFARDYPATHEGIPRVPARKVLITIGDFVVRGGASQWPATRRVRLPANPTRRTAISWHVRFAGRALRLKVNFGSAPTTAQVVLVDRILAGLRRSQ